MPFSSPNLMFDHLIESYHWDDSSKLSNIRFGEEITQVGSIQASTAMIFSDWRRLVYTMIASWVSKILKSSASDKVCIFITIMLFLHQILCLTTC